MDSLPQELINAIIDNVPDRANLSSCSLVAKRWRLRSQQRAFEKITIRSEYKAKLWCKNISQEPDGTSSFVRIIHFMDIPSWDEPALFGRVLKGLTSLIALWASHTEIPDELRNHISRGELGKTITTLGFIFPVCTHATIMTIVLSLPSLEKLIVQDNGFMEDEPLSIHPVTSRRKPLDWLILLGYVDGVEEILVKYRFTSRHLVIDLSTPCTRQLIMLSAEVMVELNLYDTQTKGIPSRIHLPTLPALATLHLDLRVGGPSPNLTDLLRSISSAPVLTSVIIESDKWSDPESPFPGTWVEVDEWLARMAEHTRVKGGLWVRLRWWPEGKSVWKEFLHRFTEAGGRLTVYDT